MARPPSGSASASASAPRMPSSSAQRSSVEAGPWGATATDRFPRAVTYKRIRVNSSGSCNSPLQKPPGTSRPLQATLDEVGSVSVTRGLPERSMMCLQRSVVLSPLGSVASGSRSSTGRPARAIRRADQIVPQLPRCSLRLVGPAGEAARDRQVLRRVRRSGPSLR